MRKMAGSRRQREKRKKQTARGETASGAEEIKGTENERINTGVVFYREKVEARPV